MTAPAAAAALRERNARGDRGGVTSASGLGAEECAVDDVSTLMPRSRCAMPSKRKGGVLAVEGDSGPPLLSSDSSPRSRWCDEDEDGKGGEERPGVKYGTDDEDVVDDDDDETMPMKEDPLSRLTLSTLPPPLPFARSLSLS